MAAKNRLKQQPQSNLRGKYVSSDSQSLMKRPVLVFWIQGRRQLVWKGVTTKALQKQNTKDWYRELLRTENWE